MNSWSRVPYKTRQAIKLQLSVRDGLTCCICKQQIDSLKSATIEHKLKQKDGGSHNLSNLGLAHSYCNYSNRHAGRVRDSDIVDNSGFFEQ